MRIGNYTIQSDGQLWSHNHNRYVKWQDNGNGYKKVIIWNNGKYKNEYIHRLVAIAFVQNPNNYEYVDHIDRNKENNHYTNLRWVSAKENTANTAGKSRYSVRRSHRHHYEQQTITAVQNDYLAGMKVMEIAAKYKIPRQSISRFVKNIM